MVRGTWVATLLLVSSVASGQFGPPAPQSLLIQPGTRPAAIGECYVAVSDDAWAAFWNPGGLPLIEERVSGAVMYSSLMPDWGGVEYWAAATVLRTKSAGAVSLGWTHLVYGEFPTEPYGSETYEAWESVLSIGYGFSPIDDLGIGVTVRRVESEASLPVERGGRARGEPATGTVFDIGVLYRIAPERSSLGLRYGFGVAVRHLGGGMDYDDISWTEETEMPRALHLGASCATSGGRYADALLCAEYKHCLMEEQNSFLYWEDPVLSIGLELRIPLEGDVLALRTGYVHDEDGEIKGFSLGLGITVDSGVGPVSLDFANVPQAEGLSRPWRIGGGVGLGG